MKHSGKRNKAILAGLALGLSVFAAGAVQAEEEQVLDSLKSEVETGRQQKHLEKRLERMDALLGLSDEQKAEIRRLVTADRAAGRDLYRKLRAGHRELFKLMDSDAAPQAVEERMRALSELKVEMHLRRIKTGRAIQGLLTPAQRKKMEAAHEKRRAAYGPRRGPQGEGAGKGDFKSKHDARWQKLSAELGLSTDQSQKIDAIREKMHARRRSTFEQLGPQMRALHEQARDPQVSLDRLRAEMNALADRHLAARLADFQDRREIDRLLTPDQREKLRAAMKERHKEGRHGRHGRRPHGPPPAEM